MKIMQTVDTTKTKNRTRHYGIQSTIPVFIGGKEKRGKLFSTVCGKLLRNFSDATLVSLYYTDGSVFSTPCADCLPFESKSFEAKA